MQKKGIVALLVGLLLVAMIPTVMARTGGGNTDDRETCGDGLGQADVHMGFDEYRAKLDMKHFEGVQDKRPWLKNIWRSAKVISSYQSMAKSSLQIFSRLASWQQCAAE